jgi:GNAT superfamily N-acetyltransferase
MIEIVTPAGPEQMDAVRTLMRTFVGWHRERHQEDIALIDRYFDTAAFEEELAGLPGKYAPPRGALLLALVDGKAAGCVALREIDAEACEMKRMFVHLEFHGQGVGRALAGAVIREAKVIGYQIMRLDTSFRQIEAQQLYRSFGFRAIEPYYETTQEMIDWLRFMELKLTSA